MKVSGLYYRTPSNWYSDNPVIYSINVPCLIEMFDMMTSSNGNIIRVTGLCAGNSPVTGEFPAQRPVMRSFDVFFDLRLNKRLSKQSWGWWFETPSGSLWCNWNVLGWYEFRSYMALERTTIYTIILCHLNGDYYIKDIMMHIPIQRDLSLF